MKTALEYYIEQLDCLNRERKENLIDAETFFKHKKILTQQANKMCEKQIMNAFKVGFSNGFASDILSTEKLQKEKERLFCEWIEQFKKK